MSLHLIKLSVGTDSIEDLEDWIKLKLNEQKKRGVKKPERFQYAGAAAPRIARARAALIWIAACHACATGVTRRFTGTSGQDCCLMTARAR